MSNFSLEKPVQFSCKGKRLYGILHLPEHENEIEKIILMVVGGPQTRIGSHRLYVQLAREFCNRGTAVFRFDYEGLGDGEGEFVGFEFAGSSIRKAIDYLFEILPNLENLIVWSLCDGSTASAIYAQNDRARITAMILCNPFVETEEGKAKTFLKYYYIRRILQKEFWQKVISLKIDVKDSVSSFNYFVKKAFTKTNGQIIGRNTSDRVDLDVPLPDQMVRSLIKFNKPIRFLLSTNDLTAMEFRDIITSRKELTSLMKNDKLTIKYVEGADHTFSNQRSKRLVAEQTLMALKEFELLDLAEVFA